MERCAMRQFRYNGVLFKRSKVYANAPHDTARAGKHTCAHAHARLSLCPAPSFVSRPSNFDLCVGCSASNAPRSPRRPPPTTAAHGAHDSAQWSPTEFLFWGFDLCRSNLYRVCLCVPASGVALSTTAVCRRRKSCTVYAPRHLPLAHSVRDKAVACEMLRQKRLVKREAVWLRWLQDPGLKPVADGVAPSLQRRPCGRTPVGRCGFCFGFFTRWPDRGRWMSRGWIRRAWMRPEARKTAA